MVADDCADGGGRDCVDLLTLPPPPGAAPDALERQWGRPRPLGAGRFGWKSSNSMGSRMSSRTTQDRSSGPYPSQSTKYSSRPPRFIRRGGSWCRKREGFKEGHVKGGVNSVPGW